MILILSIKGDYSTYEVCEWLRKLGKKFIRINGDSDNDVKFIHHDISSNELILSVCGKELNILDVTSVWYRRSGLTKNMLDINVAAFKKNVVFPERPNQHVKHHHSETKILLDLVYYHLEKRNMINSYFNASLNKLIVLDIAKNNGLQVPLSYIVTTKTRLVELLAFHGSLITKALSEGVYLFTENYAYYSYTERLTPNRIKDFPETFFPSLAQVEIKKKYELRIFYLEGKCYPMAIFSQRDTQTQVDFRKYNLEKPNRSVPYSLPMDVQVKIHGLMADMKLNSGSIDMVVDKQNNYFFLEVNPVGQFSMTSRPCNYFLDKRIAEIL